MTMQGYFLAWIYFLLNMQDCLAAYCGISIPGLKYYIEIVFEVAFCVEMPITIMYWAVLHQILLITEGVTGIFRFNTRLIHPN